MHDGLEGIVVAETRLSDVDGARGRLTIAGHLLDDLVRAPHYEHVLALLLAGLFEDLPSEDELVTALAKARAEVFDLVQAQSSTIQGMSPVDGVRAMIAQLPDGNDLKSALRLLAAPGVFTPAMVRLGRGLGPIAPRPGTGHAADMLFMLAGKAVSRTRILALDTYLVTVADHGLNASTFTGRVVASTGAGLVSVALAAYSALKGPLHGGAPGPVLDMLDGIGDPGNAEAWLENALARGDRLMGFGHRIYKVRDPRADALKGAVRVLAGAGEIAGDRLALAEGVEAAALAILKRKKPDRRLETNVEFYTAILLEALGFPREAFTAVFATGRMGGWIAHAREQALTGRLIRPQSRYIGPLPVATA